MGKWLLLYLVNKAIRNRRLRPISLIIPRSCGLSKVRKYRLPLRPIFKYLLHPNTKSLKHLKQLERKYLFMILLNLFIVLGVLMLPVTSCYR